MWYNLEHECLAKSNLGTFWEPFDFLEGYAAFTRDAPLAGRNLDRNAEDPIVKGTCVIAYTGTVWDSTSRSTAVTPLFYGWHFQAGTFFRIDIFHTVLPTGFHPAPPTHPNSNDLLSTRWSIHSVVYPRQNRDFKKIDTVPVYTRTGFSIFFWDKISKISTIRNGTLSIWSLTESLGP